MTLIDLNKMVYTSPVASGHTLHYPGEEIYQRLKDTTTLQLAPADFYIEAWGPIDAFNPYKFLNSEISTMTEEITNLILCCPKGHATKPFTKVSTNAPYRWKFQGHNINELAAAAQIMHLRLREILFIKPDLYIGMDIIPRPIRYGLPKIISARKEITPQTEDTQYNYTGMTHYQNGAPEVHIPTQEEKVVLYDLRSPLHSGIDIRQILPTNSTGKYFIEVCGNLKHINPFNSEIKIKHYLGEEYLSVVQMILRTYLVNKEGQIARPFSSISTPTEGNWLIHGDRADLTNIAAETKLRPILIDILTRSKEYVEKTVDISIGLNVYASIQEHTIQNTTGKRSIEHSSVPKLPYEVIKHIADYENERDELAWNVALDCVKTQYEKYNMQAKTPSSYSYIRKRNPYEALLHERTCRYYNKTRAFRARATMYREMIHHMTHPNINPQMANWWGEHLRIVDAYMGRGETNNTQYTIPN